MESVIKKRVHRPFDGQNLKGLSSIKKPKVEKTKAPLNCNTVEPERKNFDEFTGQKSSIHLPISFIGIGIRHPQKCSQ
jgi:hypothetical protein